MTLFLFLLLVYYNRVFREEAYNPLHAKDLSDDLNTPVIRI